MMMMMMINNMRIGLFIGGLGLIVLIGCQKNPADTIVKPYPRLFFAPSVVDIAIGQPARLNLKLEGVKEAVFALSLRLSYADSIIAFPDSAGLQAGDYFAPGALVFARAENSILHLSISSLQTQPAAGDSNTVCSIVFCGLATGSSPIRILPDQLDFYDMEGENINLPALEISAAVINVR